MSHLRRPAPKELQPTSFAFTPENQEKAKKIIAKYPEGRQQSAVMPLLDLAQRQTEGNWVPTVAMDYIADMLEMPAIRVYEVATFYTMYNLAPVGKNFIQVCTTRRAGFAVLPTLSIPAKRNSASALVKPPKTVSSP